MVPYPVQVSIERKRHPRPTVSSRLMNNGSARSLGIARLTARMAKCPTEPKMRKNDQAATCAGLADDMVGCCQVGMSGTI